MARKCFEYAWLASRIIIGTGRKVRTVTQQVNKCLQIQIDNYCLNVKTLICNKASEEVKQFHVMSTQCSSVVLSVVESGQNITMELWLADMIVLILFY